MSEPWGQSNTYHPPFPAAFWVGLKPVRSLSHTTQSSEVVLYLYHQRGRSEWWPTGQVVHPSRLWRQCLSPSLSHTQGRASLKEF